MEVLAAEPILAVRDIERSIAYYRDALGFDRAWTYLDPPAHGGISLGRFQVQFTPEAGQAARRAGAELMFRVDNVRTFHDRHRASGATIVAPLENKPWGMAEYAVLDPDGHRLRFAGAPMFVPSPAAAATLPARYRVEIGAPSVDDFARLHDDVGWARPGDAARLASVLSRSTFCAVATDTASGDVVGMLRVVGDGLHFAIWDVMVRPADQGQRVGSTLIRVALDHLRTLAPRGTFVGLFSTKPAFYERLGFTHGGGLHLPL